MLMGNASSAAPRGDGGGAVPPPPTPHPTYTTGSMPVIALSMGGLGGGGDGGGGMVAAWKKVWRLECRQRCDATASAQLNLHVGGRTVHMHALLTATVPGRQAFGSRSHVSSVSLSLSLSLSHASLHAPQAHVIYLRAGHAEKSINKSVGLLCYGSTWQCASGWKCMLLCVFPVSYQLSFSCKHARSSKRAVPPARPR